MRTIDLGILKDIFIRYKRRKEGVTTVSIKSHEIPKRVFIFWDKGEQNAPEVVRKSISSWRLQNPDFEVIVLDNINLNDWLPDLCHFPHPASLASYSDILRVELLRRYGGCWCDATTVCTLPINQWLPLLFQEGFFCFSYPHKNRMVASWFIASVPQHLILQILSSEVFQYWTSRESPSAYFWFHYLFEYCFHRSKIFRNSFNSVPKICANNCHLIAHWSEGRVVVGKEKLFKIVSSSPLQKLSHKNSNVSVALDALEQLSDVDCMR